MFINPEDAGQYPYLTYHIGPNPYPVWNVAFLDPKVPLAYYREKAAATAGRQAQYLALGPSRAIRYRKGRAPEACAQTPGGSRRVASIPFEFTEELEPKREAKALVAIRTAGSHPLETREDDRLFIAETADSELYVASLAPDRKAPLALLAFFAAGFAAGNRQTCYLWMNSYHSGDTKGGLCFRPDGSSHAIDRFPPGKTFTYVPLHDWSGGCCPG